MLGQRLANLWITACLLVLLDKDAGRINSRELNGCWGAAR